MKSDIVEAIRMDGSQQFSCEELASLSGLTPGELLALVDSGVLDSYVASSTQLSFTARSVMVARSANRLRNDFELDTSALALVVAFSVRIAELETQLVALRARAPADRR